MAVELATGYVNIVPSARGFGATLRREMGGQVDAAGDEAGQRFGSRLGAGIATAAKVASTGIVALGTAAGGFGLKIAEGNESAQISFETMLGSADKASSFLADLKRFAAATPFEFPELQTAAGSLISIGVSAEKVIPIMTTLGNVTSGMGTGAEGVKRATVALQQMNAAGRITAEDLNQLRDAGIPVFDLLTAATGKTKEQLAAMAQNGKLGRQELDALMKALETGKGLERFNGLMEKQSQSLKGIISTLKDTLGQGLADAVAPALGPIKDSIKGLSDAIGTELVTWGPTFASAITTVVDIVSRLVRAGLGMLGPFVSLVASALAELAPIVDQLAGPLAELANVIAVALNGALDNVLPVFGELLVAVVPLLKPIGLLVKQLAGPLARAFAELVRAVIPLIRPLVRLVTILMERIGIPTLVAIVGGIEILATNLALVADAVGRVLDAGLGEVIDWFGRLTEDPGAALGALAEGFAKLPSLIGDVLSGLGRWLWDHVFTPAKNYLVAQLPRWIDGLGAFFRGLPERWAKAIGDLGRWLWDHVFIPAKQYIADHLDGWIDALGVFFRNLPTRLGTAIGNLGQWLWDNVFTPARTFIEDHLDEWVGAVTGFFGKLPERLGAAIETDKKLGEWLWDNVFSPAKDYLVTKAPEWGDAVAKIGEGVPAKIGGAVDGATGLGEYLWTNVFVPAVPVIQANAGKWATDIARSFARLPGEIVRAITMAGDIATLIWDEVLVPAAKNLATMIPIWISAVTPEFLKIGRALVDAIVFAFNELPGKILFALLGLGAWLFTEVFLPAMNYLGKQLPDLFRSLGRLAIHILFGIGEVLDNLAGSIWDNWLKPALTSIANDFKKGIAELVNGLVDVINSFIQRWNDLPIPGKTDFPLLPKMEGFARGGRPPVGEPSIVGEAGPELFVPSTAGRIIPNDALGAPGGLTIGSVTVTGQERPTDTAFALRSELRWLALTTGSAA